MPRRVHTRLLGALLSAALVAGLVPAPALAEIVGDTSKEETAQELVEGSGETVVEPSTDEGDGQPATQTDDGIITDNGDNAAQVDEQEIVGESEETVNSLSAVDGVEQLDVMADEDSDSDDQGDPENTADEGYILYSGEWGTCPWEITADGTLTVYPGTGTDHEGSYAENRESLWCAYNDNNLIRHVVFAEKDGKKVIAPADCTALLAGLATVTTIDASGLDTSGTVNMTGMFAYCGYLTSLNTTGWNTINVTDMRDMFSFCYFTTSLDLSGWDTRNVTDMYNMFGSCVSLRTIYVGSSWSTGALDGVGGMNVFHNCTSLKGGAGTAYSEGNNDASYARIDGGTQSPGYLTYKGYLQTGEWGTCQWDIWSDGTLTVHPGTGADYANDEKGPWTDYKDVITSVVFAEEDGEKVEAPEDCTALFYKLENVTRFDVSGFDTSNAKNMSYLFLFCSSITSLDLSGWDTQNVTNMGQMFAGCSSLSTIYVDENYWSTGCVNFSDGMFYDCTELKGGAGTSYNEHKIDASYACVDGGGQYPGYLTSKWIYTGTWGTCPWQISYEGVLIVRPGKGADFEGSITEDPNGPWTSYANQITSVVFAEEDGKKVEAPADCTFLLGDLSKATSIDASGLDTSLVENMSNMFNSCTALQSLDTTGWNTSNVTSMLATFAMCLYLPSLDVSGWDTRNVTNMSGAFAYCMSLTSLDLSGWDTGNVTETAMMFYNCSALTTICVGNAWNTDGVTSSSEMFNGCSSLVGGNGTRYSDSYKDKEYARVDGNGGPGYLTYKGENPITFTVTFVDDDETVLKEATEYPAGTPAASIVQPDETPTKEPTALYTYEFAGWDPELAPVYADVTYKATYTATPKPNQIVTQPADATTAVGDRFSLTVEATGATSYSWQASKDGDHWSDVKWSGHDTATLSYTMTESLNGRKFRCTVTFADDSSETSRVATVTLPEPSGRITTQPQDATLAEGERISLSVTADGATSYRWQASRTGASWSDVAWAGADTSTLRYKMVSSLDGRKFRCVVTFEDGTTEATDVATLTLVRPTSGRITSQPQGATLAEGERISLSVTADGATSYRWQASRNGTSWSDVTWSGHDAATLTYVMRESLNGRQFRCVVTFSDGSSEVSDVATLTLAEPK